MNRLRGRIFGINAQATTELAIFGAIFLTVLGYLVSYGLNYNYNQNLSMETFRTALAKAYDASKSSFSGSVVIVKDKPIPDPSDAFGIPTRSQFVNSNSATWSNMLYSEYQGKNYYMNPLAITKLTLIVNDREYQLTNAGFIEYRLENAIIDHRPVSYVTVRHRKNDFYNKKDDKCPYPDGDCYINKYNPAKRVWIGEPVDTEVNAPGDGIYWYWKEIPEHTVKEIKKNEYYDVNQDDKEEQVLIKECPDNDGVLKECDEDSKDAIVKRVKVVSDILGELDTTQTTQEIRQGELHGGLQTYSYEKFRKTAENGQPTFLRTQENNQRVKNIATHHTKDTIHRYVLLNKITYYPPDSEGHKYYNILEQIRCEGYSGPMPCPYNGDDVYVGDKDHNKIYSIRDRDEFDPNDPINGLKDGQYLWLKIESVFNDNKTSVWETRK